MYLDHSPEANSVAERVLVIEADDHDADDAVEMARGVATTNGGDETVFWVVFADEPHRVWDMTESVLRHELRKRSRS